MSQTVNGYTVTLYPSYADANRIVFTYTVQSLREDLSRVSPFGRLAGEAEEAYGPRLTDEQGRGLLRLDSWGIPYYPTSSLLAFDSGEITGTLPSVLKLHLVLNNADVLIGDQHGGGILHGVKGPFVFDFALPVDPVRRIAEVQQTSTGYDGSAVTIEKVIVTRQDVRVRWRVSKPTEHGNTPTVVRGPPDLYACCRLRLESGDEHYTPSTRMGGLPVNEDGFVHASLIDKEDEWTISAWYFSTWMGDAWYPDQPGPVFHFTVPPAITSSKEP